MFDISKIKRQTYMKYTKIIYFARSEITLKHLSDTWNPLILLRLLDTFGYWCFAHFLVEVVETQSRLFQAPK